MFVQTSVAGLERHLARSDYGTGLTFDAYAAARLLIEARLRTSTLRRWTVLRPVTLMESYLPPKARAMFPWLAEGRLDSVHSTDMPIQLFSVVDIARFAVAALRRDPDRFDRQIIELNGDEPHVAHIAAALSDATGIRITYRAPSATDALRDGMLAGVAHSQEWANQIGYGAPSPEDVHTTWGIKPTPFTERARADADLFDVAR
ncbi:hypothetical protein SGFS_064200 [Streptomyces graminofaciens]|uniref:Uncharacterized protein n=2 Tax=Streptomyces graminofaciens TaxID=68212 RepID=A0ABM7FDK6_9ACTN|nr:hypothetical protein [Streptomyces graminofaciens]BBC35126.1 hypothetical protein SGFS_064200 [Streptomyces graminofaciens]